MHAPAISWLAISPIIALTGAGVLTVMLGSISRLIPRSVFAFVSLLGLTGAGILTWILRAHKTVGMQGSMVLDGVSLFGAAILIVTCAITIVLGYEYMSARGIHRFEMYPLLLFATAGMMLTVQANDLLLLFLAIEILSLALYVLTAFARRDSASQEGAMKYFLLGAFSSAFLLYGIALTWGATQTTNLARISDSVTQSPARLVFLAFGLIAVGLAFKIAAVPFHMWTPDVYQGAPTPVTAFMAAGTKTAAAIAILRVFVVAFGPLQWDWQPLLFIIAILTMVVGSVVAIVQSDLKRMLAYSSIAHAGYLLVGVMAASKNGTGSVLFYLVVYSVATVGAFGLIIATGLRGNERTSLGSWQGLGQRSPVVAGAMTLFLLSLAGVPPTAGFMGKLFIFSAAIEAHETALVVAGVVTSVIAAFFYLRLIVLMWMADPLSEDEGVRPSRALTAALGLVATATILLGVWPSELLSVARHAAVFLG
ncbi:MAG: NADH-quinone oxidoreductase subunit NuoN [Actinomycetota bacterium]